MLVFARRIGEEIYVPSYDVTIKVLGRKGSGVRLGISAPSAISVRRDDVALPGRARVPSAEAISGEPEGPPCSSGPNPPAKSTDLAEHLVRHIVQRVGPRIQSLSIGTDGEALIVRGRTRSYYARQLAQHAALQFLGILGITNSDAVQFEIEVRGVDRGPNPAAPSGTNRLA
jgi:carbon storage regulator CsrA